MHRYGGRGSSTTDYDIRITSALVRSLNWLKPHENVASTFFYFAVDNSETGQQQQSFVPGFLTGELI